MFTRFLFGKVKEIVPRISKTELIALKSGTVSIDRDLFLGKVNLPIQYFEKKNNNTQEKKVNNLLKKYGNQQFIYPNENYDSLFNYLGKNDFFSYIIDEKYGGQHLKINELSSILTKISSKNPALGVCIMVPNSLGPGELLQNYGTEKQKDLYLPKLAKGDYIPCFGLTGPNNGSDAVGSIDEGIIIEKNNKKYIKVKVNKRYITLAPVSNLIGLAINLKDPNNLLEKGKEGITVLLIKNDLKNLEKKTHHNPLNVGFPNGTIKGDLEIPIENVIGGEENCGEGWKMLMECLAAGRGICLPATANGSSKCITYGIFNYIKHREQFKIKLIKMEAIQDKFLDMMYHTWIIQCSIDLMNSILDNGEKPSVLSAIMKQQTTERARSVINHGMDIYGGSGICLGKNNFIEKFYKSAPIGITVEGSNTLTKNLIIFAQGLNKSHPYIYEIYNSILENNEKDFSENFNKMVKHSVNLYVKSIFPFGKNRLEKQTIDFACLSNFVALNGGTLKSKQMLCGDMADIMSNLYLCHSVNFYNKKHKVSLDFSQYCINRLLDENDILFNKVIDNQPKNIYLLIKHLKKPIKISKYKDTKYMINEIKDNKKIMEHIKKDLYVDSELFESDILNNLEKLNNLNEDTEEYKQLYDDVISVGEFKNI